MPRARRKPPKPKGYTRSHVDQLLHGHDFFHDAFGDDIEVMRRAWPELKREVFEKAEERHQEYACLSDHDRGLVCGGCHLMPWGWWQFDSPVRRYTGLDEAEQLRRMGVSDAGNVSCAEIARRIELTGLSDSWEAPEEVFYSAETGELLD